MRRRSRLRPGEEVLNFCVGSPPSCKTLQTCGTSKGERGEAVLVGRLSNQASMNVQTCTKDDWRMIRESLSRLTVAFQRIVNVNSGLTFGYEVLPRSRHRY